MVDPIVAYPFPIAEVVFPAASKTSHLSLIFFPIYDIYTIPPPLSQIGPNPLNVIKIQIED